MCFCGFIRRTGGERRSEQLHVVLLEQCAEHGWVGSASRGSGHTDLFEEKIEAAGNHGDNRASGSAANVLKCVTAAAWGKDGVARSGMDLNAIHFKEVPAFKNVKPFVLMMMQMKGWTLLRLGSPFEDGKCVVGIPAGDFDRDLIAHHEDGSCSGASESGTDDECWHSPTFREVRCILTRQKDQAESYRSISGR